MLRAFVYLLAWPALQLQLLLLGLISLGWNLLALLLHPLLPRETGRRIGRAMISRGYRWFWFVARCSGMLRLHADALDVLKDERGLVVVANHPSMLDAPMLMARLPRSACIMKASLVRNPFLGPGARLARYIRNDVPRCMVRQAVDDLREGGQLVLFPEGTRTTQAPLNPFGHAFTLIAQKAEVPIQTVFIDTDSPYLGKGWPLWRLPPLPIVFDVRLGRRFVPSKDHRELRHEIQSYMAAGMRSAAPRTTARAPVREVWLP
ncbi:MAG: 1-acyl-sn-glycerol-3-phosphate acyltransferase [Pseudomonadota bacterium]|nr:1-acyl-sn-glycerol-3-phosphate acyltransferase [Pseudomonadota bacterium]